MNNCYQCRHWDKSKNGDSTGECHRYPKRDEGFANDWPTTNANDWCGEFKKKGDANVKAE